MIWVETVDAFGRRMIQIDEDPVEKAIPVETPVEEKAAEEPIKEEKVAEETPVKEEAPKKRTRKAKA